MLTGISHITLFVNNQDDALTFYQKLGFKIHTDAAFGDMRWLTICIAGNESPELALMLANTDEEKALVGKQGASCPFISLETDDCRKEYERLKGIGIVCASEPTDEPWGIATALKDLYGNNIYLCQSKVMQ